MSNALINFYHNLEEPIIVYDKKLDVLYHNLSFKKIFTIFYIPKGCLSMYIFSFNAQNKHKPRGDIKNMLMDRIALIIFVDKIKKESYIIGMKKKYVIPSKTEEIILYRGNI